jgi:hypothetical protein
MSVHLPHVRRFVGEEERDSGEITPNPHAYDDHAAHDGLETPSEHGEAEAIWVLYQMEEQS